MAGTQNIIYFSGGVLHFFRVDSHLEKMTDTFIQLGVYSVNKIGL